MGKIRLLQVAKIIDTTEFEKS